MKIIFHIWNDVQHRKNIKLRSSIHKDEQILYSVAVCVDFVMNCFCWNYLKDKNFEFYIGFLLLLQKLKQNIISSELCLKGVLSGVGQGSILGVLRFLMFF